MKKTLGALMALVLLTAAAMRAQASMTDPAMQYHGMHEFGIDLVVGYAKPSGASGGLLLSTPVDVRLGFLNPGPLVPELRFAMSLSTVGGTTYSINPGFNLVYRLSGTRRHDVFATAGGSLQIIKQSIGGVQVSGAVPTVNVGFGRRNPVRSTSAIRAEGFAAWSLKNTALARPSTITVGARLGFSFFH